MKRERDTSNEKTYCINVNNVSITVLYVCRCCTSIHIHALPRHNHKNLYVGL